MLPISVVIPVYNGERYIAEAIESVLDQTRSVGEIIVVDNNCTDKTISIAKQYPVEVVVEHEQGIAAARNRGIKASKHEWVGFLDSDDVWHQEKIELQWEALTTFSDARIVTSDSGWIVEPNPERVQVPVLVELDEDAMSAVTLEGNFSYAPKYSVKLVEWVLINSSTMIFHESVFESVGLFDTTQTFTQDMEFTARALAKFPVATVKKNLAFIRRHDSNETKDLDAFAEQRLTAANLFLKQPDRYPPGIGQYFVDREKSIFLDQARAIARKDS